VLYPWSNQIIGVSQGVAQDLAQITGISPKKIEVIYNPVLNLDIFEKAKNPVDHPFFLPGKPPVILGVGRLDPQKDFSNLINAFAIVQKVTPARLVILGSGLLKRSLQALVKDLNLEDKVTFLGFVTNPYPYMINSSVFVLSSIWEGLPTVLIEALALKTPIVSTNCPSGPAEILRQGKYGHLVEPKNSKALANSILKVLSGDKKAAPSDWLEQFTIDAATQKYCNIFDKILTNS
jgi:glycosyltransferase involved in cell wall biosynthesis